MNILIDFLMFILFFINCVVNKDNWELYVVKKNL